MISPLPPEIAAVLDDGALCHVAVRTANGIHLTPIVYAVSGSALWLTTARRTVKARTWRRDPRVAGMVRSGRGTVTFLGTVRTYDLLDPGTWPESLARAPRLTLAALEFTVRNARFFAGYAVDARKVPLAWTPPGRVFVEVRLDAAALLRDREGPPVMWSWPGTGLRSRAAFRRGPSGGRFVPGLPGAVRTRVDRPGPAALAVEGDVGPVVLPAWWTREGAHLYAAVAEDVAALACAGPEAPAALTVERASRWRASAMAGLLVQGTATVHAASRLRSGRRSAETLAMRAGLLEEDPVIVRLDARRAVWWKGWAAGSAALP